MVADGPSQLLLVPHEGHGITRIDLDGSVDRSFGDQGTAPIASEDAVVTPNGKILVATTSCPQCGVGPKSEARVTRLLPDGEPDPSFGVGGSVDVPFGRRYDYGEAVALAANGDILLSGIRVNDPSSLEGDFSLAVARLGPNGSLDRSFGKKGVRIVPETEGEIYAVAIAPTPSGAIVLEGSDGLEDFFCKLAEDGSFDRRFGRAGFLELQRQHRGYSRLSFAPNFAVLPSGKLMVAATQLPGHDPRRPRRAVAIRLWPGGRIDYSYGNRGLAVATTPAGTIAKGLTLLPSGVLVVSTTFVSGGLGEDRDFGAIAFSPDGHIEPTVGQLGRCRARLPGEQEALDVAAVGKRVVVVGRGGAGLKLLSCPAPAPPARLR